MVSKKLVKFVESLKIDFTTLERCPSSEVVVGYWRNKPIYRKAFSGSVTIPNDGSRIQYNLDSATNHLQVVDFGGTYSLHTTIDSSHENYVLLPVNSSYDSRLNYDGAITVRINSNRVLQLLATVTSAYSGQKLYYDLYVDYTKTN